MKLDKFLKKYWLVLILVSVGIAAVCGKFLSGDSRVEMFQGTPTVTSTHGVCVNDNDCVAGGCNEEICQSSLEEASFSICVYNPPYPKDLGYSCKCVNSECVWIK